MDPRTSRLPIHTRALGVADGLIDALASRQPMWRSAILLCLVVSVPSPLPVGWAGNCGERLQDELWLVSARQCCSVSPGVAPELSTQRYDRDSGWQPADIRELFQPTTPDQIVVIYIHGNRVPSEMAAPEGQLVYRLLTAGVDDATPIRFVIWSWPSARVHGQLRDVRTKADRTELTGYCLAWLLSAPAGESACEPAWLQLWGADCHGGNAPGRWWPVVRPNAAAAPRDIRKHAQS